MLALIGNIVWICTGGWLTALWWLAAGLAFCVTVVGVPFGVQLFKMAKLALCPFGAEVR